MKDIVFFISQNIILVAGWFAVASALIILEIRIRKFGPKKLGVNEVINFINTRNAIVLDLRSKAEFNKGHISNAENYEFSELHDINLLLKKLESRKESPVVLVCKDGVKSSQEAFKLKKNKIEEVGYLNGGMLSWLSEGLPTVNS